MLNLSEEDIIKQLRKENRTFREYEKDHERLSKKLDKLQKRKTLLPEEEMTVKKLHKEKLVLKDNLFQLIKRHRENKG